MYRRGFCDLGNTLLKTEIVRKVGMPLILVEEDWELRNRIEAIGYKWVTNFMIWVPHLKSDVDVLRHSIWWGKMNGKMGKPTPYLVYLRRFGYHSLLGLLTLNENHLWIATNNLASLYGRLLGQLDKNQ